MTSIHQTKTREWPTDRTTVFLGRASFRMIPTGQNEWQESLEPAGRRDAGTTHKTSLYWSLGPVEPEEIRVRAPSDRAQPWRVQLGLLAVVLLGAGVTWFSQTAKHRAGLTAPATVSQPARAPSSPVRAAPVAPTAIVSPAAAPVRSTEIHTPDRRFLPSMTTSERTHPVRTPPSIPRATGATRAEPTAGKVRAEWVDPFENEVPTTIPWVDPFEN